MAALRSATGAKPRGRRAAGILALTTLPRLSPLLFGVPVFLGIVVTVVHLVGIPYPFLGKASDVNTEAEVLYLGRTLYQNPAHGYAGMLYTPLYPAFVSLFDHIYLWDGWAPLVTIGACASLQGLAIRLAYAPVGSAPRLARALGAVGMGGVVYWSVATLQSSELDEAVPDHMAWALALFGLITVAGLGPATASRRRVVLAALLLCAAFWSKQTTLGVAALSLVWIWSMCIVTAIDRRTALLFTAVLVGVDLAVLFVLNLITHGWEFFFNFQMPSRQVKILADGTHAISGLQGAIVGVAFVVIIWLSLGVALVRLRRTVVSKGKLVSRLRGLMVAEDATGRRALLLCIYILFGSVLALYAMRKDGADNNEFIGVVWALGLLAALGWRMIQRYAAAAAAAGGCVAVFFVLAQYGPFVQAAANVGVAIPALEGVFPWEEIPPEWHTYALHHSTYVPGSSDLNIFNGSPIYPSYDDITDLLDVGTQPMYLVRALLDRRFDAVMYFWADSERYSSALGKWEENYMWKLNQVIAARYMKEPGIPFGGLGRRPGPERAAWMRSCFGPFVAGGASFRIRHGGGFWCSFEPGVIRLVKAPVPVSEVLTTQPVGLRGAISVRLHEKPLSEIKLVLGPEGATPWKLSVTSIAGHSRELAVSTYLGSARLGGTIVTTVRLPHRELGVSLQMTPTSARPGPPAVVGHEATVVTSVPATKSIFALLATAGAGADFREARLVR